MTGGHDSGLIMPFYCEFWLYLHEKFNQDIHVTAPRPPRTNQHAVSSYCYMLLCWSAPIQFHIKNCHVQFHPETTPKSRGTPDDDVTRFSCWKELLQVLMRDTCVYIEKHHLDFLNITLPKYVKRCWLIAFSLGMGAGTMHGFHFAAKSCYISSSYNKTTASQVNIDHPQVKGDLVLSLEWMATSCVVGKWPKFWS